MAHAMPPPPTARLFTRDEYHRMGEAGLFLERNERVELLDGEIVAMSPQSSPHAGTVHRTQRTLQRALGATVQVRVQAPIVLDDKSEPEPDVAVCRARGDDYTTCHPGPADILLLVEVAESSLTYDRGRKARAYATAGIPAYWIVDLGNRVVEILTQPDQAAGTYQQRETKTGTELLALPDRAGVTVADLLPPCTT